MTDDANDNYAGVFDGGLGFGRKPALVLVDFVQAYFDKDCPLYAGVEETLEHAIALRDAARRAGILIVYTNVAYAPSLIDGGAVHAKSGTAGQFCRRPSNGRLAGGACSRQE